MSSINPIHAPPINIHFRAVTTNDLPQIVHIEAQVQPAPWSLSIFEMSMVTDRYFFVAEERESPKSVLGFLVARIFPPIAEITNFGIAPKHQQQGLGRAFLAHFFAYLNNTEHNECLEEVHLEVRVSNARALALYQKLGFVVTSRRKNYYQLADKIGREDGLLMSHYRLAHSPPKNLP